MMDLRAAWHQLLCWLRRHKFGSEVRLLWAGVRQRDTLYRCAWCRMYFVEERPLLLATTASVWTGPLSAEPPRRPDNDGYQFASVMTARTARWVR